MARAGWASTEATTETRSVTLSIEGELQSQEFGAWSLTPDRDVEVEISVDVVGNDNIDVATMEDDEFDRYRDGKSVSLISALSMLDVNKKETTGTIGEGDYMVIFDNTFRGDARAVDAIAFSAEITGRAL